MSEDNSRDLVARRKRVQRLKKIIIVTLLTSILIPFVLCILLFIKVNNLNQRLDALNLQLENLTQISMEQQNRLQQWMTQQETKGQGTLPVGASDADAVNAGALVEQGVSGEETKPEGQLHKVYLTFDDGPSKYTEEILAILDQYQVKATFFVVGKEDEASQEALQRIVAKGHTLGLHSYSHKYDEIYESEEAFSKDFIRLQNYVYDVTGVRSNIYRFPGGSSNTVSELDMKEFARYLEEQDVEYYDWNISSEDGGKKLLDAETIVENSITDIEKYETSIILMHDSADKPTTVEALPTIIESILAMEDTVILPITEDTVPVQHIKTNANE